MVIFPGSDVIQPVFFWNTLGSNIWLFTTSLTLLLRIPSAKFYVHGTVLRQCIHARPTRCNVTQWYLLLRPSSGAQNCIHSIGYLSSFFCFVSKLELTHDSGKKQKKLDKNPMLCIQFWAPDDGWGNRLKHVEHI